MADFTVNTLDYNKGSDGTPDWTGSTIAFGGTGDGANEFRFQRTGGGGITSTPSASWPNIIKPVANAAVEELYAFKTDTTGIKITTYDGAKTFARVIRLNFDNLGTPASAMQLSAFQDSANTTPTPGTQTPNATDGRNIINGQTTDTGSTSYFKINAYGTGVPTGGSQETPSAGNAGTTLAATSGTAGAVSPSAASWLATWQSAQGWTQYITAPAVWKATTAGFWYISCALYVGPNMQTGSMVWTPFVLSYTWT